MFRLLQPTLRHLQRGRKSVLLPSPRLEGASDLIIISWISLRTPHLTAYNRIQIQIQAQNLELTGMFRYYYGSI